MFPTFGLLLALTGGVLALISFCSPLFIKIRSGTCQFLILFWGVVLGAVLFLLGAVISGVP